MSKADRFHAIVDGIFAVAVLAVLVVSPRSPEGCQIEAWWTPWAGVAVIWVFISAIYRMFSAALRDRN